MYKFATGIALATLAISLGFVSGAPTAQAQSLVPKQEGEVHLQGIGCIVSSADCIDTSKLGYTVTSLPYDFDNLDPQHGLSRLFVDTPQTANNWGFGINFGTQDAGTNPPSRYWFRPVAYFGAAPDSPPTGTPEEGGQLEVGRFEFDFANTVSTLALDFFDTEDSNITGILDINGNPVSTLLPGGENGNQQTLTLHNVNSFVVQVGNPGPNSVFPQTGDGVDLVVSSIPESSSTIGFAALALAGILNWRKGQKA